MINPTNSTTPFMMCNNPYDFMKSKTQNKVRYTAYANILFNTMLEMFDYNGLPDTIPKRFLETILHTTGEVFVSKINNEIIASHGTLSGDIDAYGLGTNCVAVCPTGSAEGVRNIDIAYGINNDTATPDMIIYWIANLLAETDKSIKLNVIYSRLLKIPKVGNEKDKAMFKELLKKVMDGEPEAFASSNALDLELGAGTETFELTDANKIDKLPYLTQFFEDCLKRFYCFYGQPMQNQNKRAQSISDEIHGQDSVSMILPLQMLKCRQALCENINNIFGTEISVDFNPLWKIELAGVIERDTNGNMIPDESEVNGNDDTNGTTKETYETGTESNGTGTETDETSETENNDTETDETDGTEKELIEQIENSENAPDLPDMGLEADNPIESTPKTEKDETEPKSELIELKAVADALGVDAEEIKRFLKGGVDDV
jgi:hypothetical protein